MKKMKMKRSLILILAVALIIMAALPLSSMAGNGLQKNDLTVLKTVVNKDNVADPYDSYRFKLELTQPNAIPKPVSEPKVKTGDATKVSNNTALIVSSSHSDFKDIQKEGIEYSINPNFTGSLKTDADGLNSPFDLSLIGLTANTTYYYKAYGVEVGGAVVYGETKQFHTSIKPIVVTGDPYNLRHNSCMIISSKYTSMPGVVEQTGIIYSTEPDVSGGKSVEGNTLETPFGADIRGLKAETKYYYRAFTICDGITYYGDIRTFTTLKTPIVNSPAPPRTVSSIPFEVPGCVYADTDDNSDYIPVDMPLAEFTRLSGLDIDLKQVSEGVYTFNLKKGESINVNGLDENIKFKVTELGGISDSKNVDLEDPAGRCSSFLNDSETEYPNTSGIMSGKMDSEFIYTFPGKDGGNTPPANDDGKVKGETSDPANDDGKVKGETSEQVNNQKVLGQEARTADAMNMVPLLMAVGLIALFVLVIARQANSRKEQQNKY